MREPYEEGLASHLGPESYADNGNSVGVALTRGTRRPGYGAPKSPYFVCRRSAAVGRQYRACRQGKIRSDTAESENLSMRENFKRENREILLVSAVQRDMVTAGRNGQKTFTTVMLT